MTDLQKRPTLFEEQPKGKVQRTLTFCIRDQLYVLEGSWTWAMQSDHIYCSVVMDFPVDFEGTKGIIHPKDVPLINAYLTQPETDAAKELSFQIITTYGDVQSISGYAFRKSGPFPNTSNEERRADTFKEIATRQELADLKQLFQAAESGEQALHSGMWIINKATSQVYYSDHVFRLYGLQPQSLNAHLHTFHPFIYSEDREIVTQAFESSYEKELPLHLEFRIQQQDGTIKTIHLISTWIRNEKGESLFCGFLKDISEEMKSLEEKEKIGAVLKLQQQITELMEQHNNIGYWYINLLTRSITFSESYLRIYGIKPSQSPSQNTFINLVHPEDRRRVEENMELMYKNHSLADIEFRIIRPDGKVRLLRKKGKLTVYDNAELLMLGTIQDITSQNNADLKLTETKESLKHQRLISQIVEDVTGRCYITWDAANELMHWSDGFYTLMGYKPESMEPSLRLIQKRIHPDHLRAFNDTILLAQNGQLQNELIFKMATRTGYRLLKMVFRQLLTNSGEQLLGIIEDVSCAVQTQQQLEEEQMLRKQISNTIHEGLIITNEENTVLVWNHEMEERTHIKQEEALNKNFFDVIPQLKTLAFISHIQEAQNGKTVSSFYTQSGYFQKPHHFRLTPLRDKNEKIIGLIHSIQDVAHEQALTKRLEERLNFIESLIEASRDRIVVLDRNMNYLYWNHKAEEYYAIKKDRIIGKNILEVFPAFRNEPGYQEFRKVLRGETVYLSTLGADDPHLTRTILSPIKDENGAVTAILWVVHNDSEEAGVSNPKANIPQL